MPDRFNLSEALKRCESEPIQFAGAIQSHGHLVACTHDGIIRHLSGRLSGMAGQDAAQLLNRSLSEVFGRSNSETLLALWPTLRLDRRRTLLLPAPPLQGTTVWVHRSGDLLVIEFGSARTDMPAGETHLAGLMLDIDDSASISDCCQHLAAHIRQLTGFDRVLVYRFDPEWDGEVVAESRNQVLPSLLGHRFPASDIPAQARALYARNPIRALADTDAEPTPVLTADPEGAALDLSLSILRSMSPVHLRYLRNMATRASLSLSLCIHGRLWGLVACHHQQPRPLTLEHLARLELAGRMASLKLSTLLDGERIAYLDRISQALSDLTRLLASGEAHEAIQQFLADDILPLIHAGGCLLTTDGEYFQVGQVPPPPLIDSLTEWLRTRLQHETRVVTHHLAACWSAGSGCAETAAGVLALPLMHRRGEFIVWFRPQAIQEIQWAGKPEKIVEHDEDGPRIEPRRSFAQWRETVHGKSRHWESIEIDAATTISHALQAILMERSLIQTERELRQTAESTNRLKTQFLNNISHELRTPLHAILGFTEILQRRGDQLSADKRQNYLDNILHSGKRLHQLVQELLNLTQLQADKASVVREVLSLDTLVSQTLARLRHEGYANTTWHVRLSRHATDPRVTADPILLGRTIRHLLVHAHHHSSGEQPLEVTIHDLPGDSTPTVTLDIHAPNWTLPDGDAESLFQPTSSGRAPEHNPLSSGLALGVCREIIKLHHGSIEAHNHPEGGVCLRCSLPRTPAAL